MLLLDDRPEATAGDRDAVHALLGEFLRAVDEAESGKVTIRIHPPGREFFASVSDDEGVRRYR